MRLSRHLFCACLVLVVFAGDVSAAAQKQVLVLYSTRRDAQIVAVAERDLPQMLEDGLGESVDYYSEYIDQARFPEGDYQLGFRDFLKLKYRDLRFSLVIALQDVAAEFIGRHRHELFADVPVVYFANSSGVARMANSTGVVAVLDFAPTLTLAIRLQPETRNVFVVAGAATGDRNYESLARAQLKPFESRLNITYLSGLTTAALEARLAALPPQSIVYYLLVDQDGGGERFHPLDYLDRVAAVANAPTYCWVDSAIGRGVVGGNLKDQQKQIEAIGELALRVLHREAADSIPLSSPDLNTDQVDWRQLQRWDISASRLPAGTIVKFREPSVWDRYRLYILGAVALVLAQSALIVGLLVHRARRRAAEEQVRGSQSELRTSYERIRDLAGRLLNAQEAERSRIARDLHDDISQQMALLSIDLELLGGAVSDSARVMAGDALRRAHGIARSIHDLSHRLHPAKLRLIGLVAGLQGLQHELQQSGVSATFVYHDVPTALPTDLTLCLFRVAQEALQNSVKHGRARHVAMGLYTGTTGLVLTIADDGIGFDVVDAYGKGLGLISIGERIEAVGGSLEIRSLPDSGTRMEIVVPLPVAEDQTAATV